MKRKSFIHTVLPFIGGIVALPGIIKAQDVAKPPVINSDLVKNFVAAGHNNFEKVKELLQESPNLLYAAWDWGGGDFETAFEAAGHVGNKEIANYLIEKGARTNLFVLTMLGKNSIVKPFIEANPSMITARG